MAQDKYQRWPRLLVAWTPLFTLVFAYVKVVGGLPAVSWWWVACPALVAAAIWLAVFPWLKPKPWRPRQPLVIFARRERGDS